MNDLPGADNPVTDTWFHLVLAVSSEEIKVYIDGQDVCGGGGYGRDSGRCPNVGVPDFSDTPFAERMAWTQTEANGAYPTLNSARVGGFDMTYGACPPVLECKDDRYDFLRDQRMDCRELIQLLLTSSVVPADSSACEFATESGMLVKEFCPVTCNYDCETALPCNARNMTDPQVTIKQSPLFLGGSPLRGGSTFMGSINGLGVFRYTLTGDEASCVFRFGESDIHVCQDPDDMFGLFHAMTFLPADPDMSKFLLQMQALLMVLGPALPTPLQTWQDRSGSGSVSMTTMCV